MEVLTMKELLETGVHFGHRTRKWNPKMQPYIFTERKGIHIIDLEQTVEMFKKAYYVVRDAVAEDKEILFVGTKKQVQSTISEEARRCGAHFVNRRWLGGTLTNFGTIKQSITRMKELERMIEDGSIDHVPNKEASRLRRVLAKLQRNLDGLRYMERRPDLMFVIDPDVEANAVREANIVGIPTIAIVDTNCDPDPIDYPIPGNDDAIKATKLITSRIADAVLEGSEGKQDAPRPSAEDLAAEEPEEQPFVTESESDEVEVAAEADEAEDAPEAAEVDAEEDAFGEAAAAEEAQEPPAEDELAGDEAEASPAGEAEEAGAEDDHDDEASADDDDEEDDTAEDDG
ncbi:MAG: 30S ribosomal protein S2, partial [Candidatus Bipolaricaulota bacterium]